MQPLKLVLEEVEQQPFKLIALHSYVADYKLAYLLNKHLNLRLSRTRKDVDLYRKNKQANFNLYSYQDHKQYCTYYLASNKSENQDLAVAGTPSLFNDEMGVTTTFLLPELKKVDFFLKIEGENNSIFKKPFLRELNNIPQISTAYGIDKEQIKFSENLIFDECK